MCTHLLSFESWWSIWIFMKLHWFSTSLPPPPRHFPSTSLPISALARYIFHLPVTPTSVILENCDKPLSIPSFCSILVHLGANRTMLKTWSQFIFDHSYLRYSSKLWLSTQHTFILQHFGSFGAKSDNVENLVKIHLWSFIPPLFFKTVAIHSTYPHSQHFGSFGVKSDNVENLVGIHL